MRRSSTAVLLLCLFSAPLHGQASRGPPPKPTPIPAIQRPAPQAATPAPAQSLSPIKLEDEWTKALIRRDTHMFDLLLAPNFVYTENASVMDRDDVMKSVTGSDRIEWARNEGMTVHDFGDVQVITGVLHLRGKGKQGPFDRRFQFTDTWHRQNERKRADGLVVAINDGRWQMIAAQDYLIPK